MKSHKLPEKFHIENDISQKGERFVVWNFLKYMEENCWQVAAYDDGGEDRVGCSTIEEAFEAIFAVEDILLFFRTPRQQFTFRGTVRIILGNSPEEVIADHSDDSGSDLQQGAFYNCVDAFDVDELLNEPMDYTELGALLKAVGHIMMTQQVCADAALDGNSNDQLIKVMTENGVDGERAKQLIVLDLTCVISYNHTDN